MEKTAFALRNLSCEIGRRKALNALDCSIQQGLVTGIVGPNGSGKSTLLNLLAALESPSAGQLTILDRPAASWNRQALARELAMLPQSSPVPMGVTVRELVACGRFPWVGSFGRMTKRDHAAIDEALERTGMESLSRRDVNQLSGGERQRAWLAVALAQDTKILLLDEPTSWLDIAHQLRLVDIVQTLNREKGVTVIWVLHDLNQAAQYSDQLLVLQQGQLVRQGVASEVMDLELLKTVFGVNASLYSTGEEQPGGSVWVPILGKEVA